LSLAGALRRLERRRPITDEVETEKKVAFQTIWHRVVGLDWKRLRSTINLTRFHADGCS
jgi:hypothetical protein